MKSAMETLATVQDVRLVSIRIAQQDDESPEHNLQIEPDRPILDIVKIVLKALGQLLPGSVSPRQPLTCAQPVMPGFTRWRAA